MLDADQLGEKGLVCFAQPLYELLFVPGELLCRPPQVSFSGAGWRSYFVILIVLLIILVVLPAATISISVWKSYNHTHQE